MCELQFAIIIYVCSRADIDNIIYFGCNVSSERNSISYMAWRYKHKTFDNTLDYILKYNAVCFPSALSEPQVQLVWL